MKDFLKVYAPIALLIIAGFAVAYQFIDPAPPHHLRMAAGVPGGAYDAFAKRYQAALAQNGISLDIVSTTASLENLPLLDAPKGGAARDPTVNDLMFAPNINLVDFAQAQAYSRQFRFLSVVTLPRGMINLDKDVPPHDYHLVAPAAALVARSSLHPALVDLFIAAATNINGPGQDFERPGEFPSDLHLDFPLSKEAARALANGPTFLRRYLPFWAAILVERLWILILPLITLMIPLLRIAPPTYRWQIQRKILHRYRELRAIEAKAGVARDPGERQTLLRQVEQLQATAARVQLPLGFT